MRQIKFRAWDKGAKKMIKPVERISIDGDGFVCVDFSIKGLPPIKASNIVNNFEVMQFIGLKDKNGKEIFEGDIIKSDNYQNLLIEWDEKNLVFCGIHITTLKEEYPTHTMLYGIRDLAGNFEVIGNIYENKELLK